MKEKNKNNTRHHPHGIAIVVERKFDQEELHGSKVNIKLTDFKEDLFHKNKLENQQRPGNLLQQLHYKELK